MAGLSVATALGRRFGRRGAANVTLVDRSFAHVWKPMLHTFAAGTRRSQDEQLPFVHQAARAGFRFLPGPLDGVDSEAGCITVGALTDPGGRPVAPQRRVEYDYLVIAIGSRANDFSIRGVAEHCHFIDDLPAANAFNDRLYGELLQAASYDRRLELAIVGGGATGVELAAEVSQLLDIGRAYGTQNLRPQLGITLIESGSRLLSSFPETISAAAADQLRQIGVRIYTDTRVVAADDDGFTLNNGGRIAANLRVWAAGIRSEDIPEGFSGLERKANGQLVVKPTLQVTRSDAIFAIGDCSSFIPPGSCRPLPPTAQVASQQGRHVVEQISRLLEGRDVEAFEYRERGSLVSLGQYNAWGTLGRHGVFGASLIKGSAARLGHALLYRQHQAELYGLPGVCALWASDALASFVRPPIRLG